MTKMIIRTVGVTGASGAVGRMVVEQLLRRRESVESVVRLSRRNDKFLSPGNLALHERTVYRKIDYANVASLQSSFASLDVLIFPGSDGDPEQVLAHHINVVQAAVDCKVGCFIYLSTLGADRNSPFPYARVHGETERMLKAAANEKHMRIHILRASIFTEFFLETFIEPVISIGILSLPISDGKISFVSKVDVAAALAGAAASTLEVDDQEQLSDLTGPVALSLNQLCSLFDVETKGHRSSQLEFAEMSEPMYREQLSRQGYEPWLIEAFATMLSFSIPGNYFAVVSGDIKTLSGERPCSVAEVVAKSRPARCASG